MVGEEFFTVSAAFNTISPFSSTTATLTTISLSRPGRVPLAWLAREDYC